jgi:uncharacterized protein involved in tellurium resistance
MATPEGKVVIWLKTQLQKRYGDRAIVVRYNAGRFGIKGVSDFIVSIDGYAIFIEVKAPNGKPTALQLAFLAQCNNACALGLICKGKDELIFQRINEYLHSKTTPGAHR